MFKPLLSVLAIIIASAAFAAEADLKIMHAGVKAIGSGGSPGTIVVFGENAFPVVVDASPAANPGVGAGMLGKGRIVAFGHDSMLSADSFKLAETQQFVQNAVKWASGNAEKPKLRTMGYPELAKTLGGEEIKAIPKFETGVVLVISPSRPTEAMAKEIQAFVEAGGGLLTGVPGWGWLQTHPGKSLAVDMPMNHVLASAGLAIGTGFLDRKKGNTNFEVGTISKFTNTGLAVDAVEKWLAGGAAPPAGEAEVIRAAVNRMADAVPAKYADPLRVRLSKAIAGAEGKIPVPMPKKAVGPTDPNGRLLLGITTQLAMDLPPELTKAHPASAGFPGVVPAKAERVTKKVSFTVDSTGYICNGVGVSANADIWHSTGLYAAPGEIITVELPPEVKGQGFAVQIGSHSDQLWGAKSWSRAPQIVKRTKADAGRTSLANPFGGLVYITTPVKAKLGKVEATIANAVEAPRFVLGSTTPEQWKASRNALGPWAEFESKNVIITVPSEAARKVENPAELMKFWDKVLDTCADLTAVPHERGRKERLMHDVQISAGYMHSGYPIMCPLGEIPTGLDHVKIQRDGAWGYFHEIGHNHQQPMWTFDGTTEVTCNLYSLYCLATLCPNAPIHDAMKPDSRKRNATKYLNAGAKFETWKSDPFVALLLYFQLKEEFGWDTFKKVFAEYQNLPMNERPKNDAEERDQWLIRMSNACGKNLAKQFDYWGVPTSVAAKKKVEGLPMWNHPDATK
jgi:hypothetical protein